MLARLSVCVLACLALACAGLPSAAAAAPPSWGNRLHVKGTMSLPYAGIVEPFDFYLNGDRAYVSYYSGMDTYTYRADRNQTWQVNPMNNVKTCFQTDGEVDLISYVPDTTGFQPLGDAVQINDQMCDAWQLKQTTMQSTSTYTIYVARNTGKLIRYELQGYDSLLGSHYDLYVVDYELVDEQPTFPAGIFDQPMASCGAFPGPGFSRHDPMREMGRYFPCYQQDSFVSDEFSEYIAVHGKVYSSDRELRRRERNFMRNYHFVHAHQRRFRAGKASYSVALNFLADHSHEELAARQGRLRAQPKQAAQRRSNGAMGYHQRRFSDADLPAEVDWRQKGAVTPPQDQGICGSCWSFGSTGAIEGAYYLKYGQLKVMAQQELMDCSWDFGNNACDGGEDFRAYAWIMQNGGMSFKENYGPYLMQDGYCLADQKKVDVSLTGFVNVTEGDESALMDALASVGPVSISIDASHPGFSFYTGGVYYDDACKNGPDDLDHSVLAVGYGTADDGEDYWLVKNSWSTYWADQGYIKMSRKNNNCGVATAPTYVVVA